MRDQRALRAVALQFWINGVVFASFIPRLPEIRDRIDVDLRALGLLLTLGSLGGLVGSAVCGPLIERLGTKRSMMTGAVGMIVTLPLIGIARTPLVFLAGLVLLQLFDVVTDVSMNLQGSWLSGRREVPVISRLHGLWSVGTVLGGVGATIAAATISLRSQLVVVALVLLATLAYVGPGLLTEDEHPESTSSHSDGRRAARSLGLLFATLAVAAIALELVPTDWSTLRLSDDLRLTSSRAGLGFVAVTSGMVVGRFGGDTLTSRWGGARLSRVATSTSIAGLAVGALSDNAWVALVGFAFSGLGAAVIFPRLYDDAARAPGRPGAMLGAMTAGIRIGALVIPVGVGALATTSTFDVGSAMVVVTAPAAAAMLLLRDRGT